MPFDNAKGLAPVERLRDFAAIREAARARGPRRIAVAGGADGELLRSLAEARREGLATSTVVGDNERIAAAARAAGVNLALHPSDADGKDVGFGPMPYFKVDDIDATLKALADKGVKVGKVQQEGPTRFATFWDSEGNALGLQQ